MADWPPSGTAEEMCQGYCRSRDSDIQPHGSRNVLDPRNEHNVAGKVSQRCFKMSQRP